MLWEDEETILLDSGRKVVVPGGVIGLSLDGSVLYAGGRSVMAATDTTGLPPSGLSPAEKLDVARHQVRMWESLVRNLVAASAKATGSSGHAIDID